MINDQVEKLITNPEQELEFWREEDQQRELVRMRYVPQGESGYFQVTYLDEEEGIIGSQVLDEVEDALRFLEKNRP
ncbi:hypothetical protein [Fictibacillus barbaricus]|uniref:DUF1292 domain-containing protein n=1 Tax=Fictibacillus barbaricus TaxID=182136 RepID=A0ABS2ZF93_9BACL|nr:hypothetical protein [Fictibacillus barbaricus]MBN3545276.1 hypothetical protein [Fictibacillus barbaricus]GGB60258.1 hypothetical protein GCM10007199_27690 [Fictibacillus barbaricus]